MVSGVGLGDDGGVQMRSMRVVSRYWHVAMMAFAVLLTIGVYGQALHGGFLLDDHDAILENRALDMEQLDVESLRNAAVSSQSGPLRRPLSMLTFALNRYFSERQVAAYKATNLGIHLLVGILLFVLTLRLAGQRVAAADEGQSVFSPRAVAVLTASIWLLHPLNLSPVLYVVQRMTSLAVLFMVFGLVLYVMGRTTRAAHGRRYILAGILGGGGLAILCKEIGALLPLLALLIEWLFLRFRENGDVRRNFLYAVFGFTVVLPLLSVFSFFVFYPNWLPEQYALRAFSPWERLLTEARVLLLYGQLSLVPDISLMGLFHDDIRVSRGLLSPISTFWSIAAIGVLLVAAVKMRHRHPVFAFAVLWFFAAHSMESTVLPLEIMHEHRNYLAIFGINFAIAYYLLGSARVSIRARLGVAVVILVVLATQSYMRSGAWSEPLRHAVHEAENHPESLRANMELGNAYTRRLLISRKRDDARAAEAAFQKVASLSESDLMSLVALLNLYGITGQTSSAGLVEELVVRSGKVPQRQVNLRAIQDLLRCQKRQICSLSPEQMVEILLTMIRNERLPRRFRATVVASLAGYMYNGLELPDKAIVFFEHARALDPGNLQHHVNLARALVAVRRYPEAERVLEYIEQHDGWGRFARFVKHSRAELTR